LSEALVLAERAGIDRSVRYDVLGAGAVGAPCVSHKGAACLYPESLPPAFSLEPAEKDLRLIGDLARAVDPLRARGSSPAAAASAKPVEPK
jgi:3-hydroxyisobutyrate dehydrogenase-like beta-hydroxyacid dehydrogenase